MAALSAVSHTQGAFLRVDDFETMALGNVNAQNGWRAQGASSVVTTDPVDLENQVLAVTTDSTLLSKRLTILDSTVRMLFLRFRFKEQLNLSFGLSSSQFPDQFGDFQAELSLRNSWSELIVLDDDKYDVLADLEPGNWYNAWILIDNASDTYKIYLNGVVGGPAVESDLLDAEGQTAFAFRGGSAGDLLSFFIKTGSGNSKNSGPFYLDDIYIENTPALNLRNPTALEGDPCEGDFEPNGEVNAADLAVFAEAFGRMDSTGGSPADFDLDRDVDGVDFAAFAADISRSDCL
jgi:hypothetical protein